MIRFTRLPQGIVEAKFIFEDRTITVVSPKNACYRLANNLQKIYFKIIKTYFAK